MLLLILFNANFLVSQNVIEKDPKIKVVAMEPEEAPTLSKGIRGPHQIEGIGDGFVLEIFEKHRDIVDEIVTVSSNDAIEMARKIARMEGVFLGISSGGNVVAAIRIGKQLGFGSRIVTLLPDSGTKYLTTKLVPD